MDTTREAAYIIAEKLSEHLENIASRLEDVCFRLDTLNEHIAELQADVHAIQTTGMPHP